MDIWCNKVLEHPKLKIVNIFSCRFHMSRISTLPWRQDIVWLISPTWSVVHDGRVFDGINQAVGNLPDTHSACLLASEEPELDVFENSDQFRSEFINCNILIPTDIFSPRSAERCFDAVVNSSPALFKRTHLCAGIENLCVLRSINGSEDYSRSDVYDAAELNPKAINHRPLSPPEVAEYLNQSYCGVILSAVEGRCKAATEYLYCGLPVVSTPSEGGRQVWFDDYNSIIVEPEVEAVREAVVRLKEKVCTGEIEGRVIRNRAMALRRRFCDRLRRLLEFYLRRYGINQEVDAGELLSSWLADVERTQRFLKYFSSEEEALRYISGR